MQPKVSVIIPVYNGEEYIERCILSICNQTLKDIEIIVIDDGSTDESANVIRDLMDHHKKIKLFKQSNFGVSSARNRGIMEASGEYLTFVDGDDFIHQNMLEDMYKIATRNQALLVFCQLGSGDNFLQNESILHGLKSRDYLGKVLRGKLPRTACGVLFRKNFLYSNKLVFPTDLHYGEDFLFTVKALLNTENVYFIDRPYYRVEERMNSASRKYDIEHFKNVMKIEHELRSIMVKANSPQHLEDDILVYIQTEVVNAIEKIIFSYNSLKVKIEELYKIKKSSLFNHYMGKVYTKISGRKIKVKSELFHFLPPSLLIYLYYIVIKGKK